MRAVYLNTSDQHIGNTWSPDNPGAFFPALTNQSELNNYNYQCSSWSVEDGAYLRLKNVTLGYSLPASLLAKTKILSIYGIDIDFSGIPIGKSFVRGKGHI